MLLLEEHLGGMWPWKGRENCHAKELVTYHMQTSLHQVLQLHVNTPVDPEQVHEFGPSPNEGFRVSLADVAIQSQPQTSMDSAQVLQCFRLLFANAGIPLPTRLSSPSEASQVTVPASTQSPSIQGCGSVVIHFSTNEWLGFGLISKAIDLAGVSSQNHLVGWDLSLSMLTVYFADLCPAQQLASFLENRPVNLHSELVKVELFVGDTKVRDFLSVPSRSIDIDRVKVASVGSCHLNGTPCVPCKFLRTRRGCLKGNECALCHEEHPELPTAQVRKLCKRFGIRIPVR